MQLGPFPRNAFDVSIDSGPTSISYSHHAIASLHGQVMPAYVVCLSVRPSVRGNVYMYADHINVILILWVIIILY